LAQYDSARAGSADQLAVKGPGITHACYQSPVPTDIFAGFKAQGASCVTRGGEPVCLSGNGYLYAYSRDKDGIMFETEHAEKPPFPGNMWIAHVALVSHDLDRLVEFYELLLGFKPNRRTNKAAGATFDQVVNYDNVHIRAAWFDLSNMALELWQFVNPVAQARGEPAAIEKIGYNKFAFEVMDIQQDYQRLVKAGVRFLSEPVQTTEAAEVYGRDPDGDLFSLFQPVSGSSRSFDILKKRDW